MRLHVVFVVAKISVSPPGVVGRSPANTTQQSQASKGSLTIIPAARRRHRSGRLLLLLGCSGALVLPKLLVEALRQALFLVVVDTC